MKKSVKEVMDTLEQLEIPSKGIEALQKLWANGMVFVETSDNKLAIRPRLAKIMESQQLVTISVKGSVQIVTLDKMGSDLAFDLFGDE